MKMTYLSGIGSIKANKDGLFIEGFANKKVVDRGQEIISEDAWELDNYKKNPVILYNHGMDAQLGGTPVGVATDIKATKDGLYVKARLATIDDPVIKRIRGLVEEKILRAFSVGFQAIDSDVDAKSNIRTISKAELYEVSIVGVPMNQDSIFELSGKMLKTKSMTEIRNEVLTTKGALVAGKINEQITDENRTATIEEMATDLELETDYIVDILAGNVTPVPEPILEYISEKMKLDLDELRAANKEDVSKEEPKPEIEIEPKKEEKVEDFQKCVSDKIRQCMKDGKDQDQAIAIAISECSKNGKCNVTLNKNYYSRLFELAKDIQYEIRQASQEEIPQATTTINAANTETQNQDNGSPQLDAARQTNILLGALINEVQTMSKKLDKPQEQVPPPAPVQEPQKSAQPENNTKSLDAYRKKYDDIKERIMKIENQLGEI